jgi:hypothetical protein
LEHYLIRRTNRWEIFWFLILSKRYMRSLFL